MLCAATIVTSGAVSISRRLSAGPRAAESMSYLTHGISPRHAIRHSPRCDNRRQRTVYRKTGTTYVVTEACIKCKYMDCIEVCPVDCFYEGENMLVIHPDECIDCGVCEPECPADAIKPDTEDGLDEWLEINKKFAASWPNITAKGE